MLLACPVAISDDGDELSDTQADMGEACEIEFEGPAPGTFSPLFIRNDRQVPIYIPFTISTCTFEPFAVFDGDTQYLWYDDAYVPRCEELLAADCGWGCSDGPTNAIKLEPGAQWEVAWGLYVWTPVELSAACAEGTACEVGAQCWAGRAWVEDGPLTARIRVSESCEAENCDCAGEACLLELDSLSAQGWSASEVDVEFDAGFVGEITLPIE